MGAKFTRPVDEAGELVTEVCEKLKKLKAVFKRKSKSLGVELGVKLQLAIKRYFDELLDDEEKRAVLTEACFCNLIQACFSHFDCDVTSVYRSLNDLKSLVNIVDINSKKPFNDQYYRALLFCFQGLVVQFDWYDRHGDQEALDDVSQRSEQDLAHFPSNEETLQQPTLLPGYVLGDEEQTDDEGVGDLQYTFDMIDKTREIEKGIDEIGRKTRIKSAITDVESDVIEKKKIAEQEHERVKYLKQSIRKLQATQRQAKQPLVKKKRLPKGPLDGLGLATHQKLFLHQHRDLINKGQAVHLTQAKNRALLGCLETLIEEGKKRTQSIAGKQVVAFIGETGSGKSTTINFLRGCELEARVISGEPVIDLSDNNRRDVAAIGHSTHCSETGLPELFAAANDIVYCDFPGYNDTRGALLNLVNQILIANILSRAASVKLVILMDAHTLIGGRGIDLRNLKGYLSELFGLDGEKLDRYKESILLGITKCEVISSERIQRHLRKYQFWNKHILIQPLSQEGSEPVLTQIKALKSITTTQLFKPIINTEIFIACYNLFKHQAQTIQSSLDRNHFEGLKDIFVLLHYFSVCRNSDINELYISNLRLVDSKVSAIEKNILIAIQENKLSISREHLALFQRLKNVFLEIKNYEKAYNDCEVSITKKYNENRLNSELAKIKTLFTALGNFIETVIVSYTNDKTWLRSQLIDDSFDQAFSLIVHHPDIVEGCAPFYKAFKDFKRLCSRVTLSDEVRISFSTSIEVLNHKEKQLLEKSKEKISNAIVKERAVVLSDKLVKTINNKLRVGNVDGLKTDIEKLQAVDPSKLEILACDEFYQDSVRMAKDEMVRGEYASAKQALMTVKSLESELSGFHCFAVGSQFRVIQVYFQETINTIFERSSALVLNFIEVVLNNNRQHIDCKAITMALQCYSAFKEGEVIGCVLEKWRDLKECYNRCMLDFLNKFMDERQYHDARKMTVAMILLQKLVTYANDVELNAFLKEECFLRLISNYEVKHEGFFLERVGQTLLYYANDDDDLNLYAKQIMDDYAVFRRIKIKLFNKKVSKKSQKVFEELQKTNNLSGMQCAWLKSTYEQFIKTYDKQLNSVIKKHKKHEHEMAVISSLVESARNSTTNVANLIAYIFVVWSSLDIYQDAFSGDEESFLQPHATQVISILLLLGKQLGVERLDSHFLEIGTGCGKSVVLAVTGIALALSGYSVDIACYSDYLARRDEAAFKKLMAAFSVEKTIKYYNFNALVSNKMHEQYGYVCQNVQTFLSGGNPTSNTVRVTKQVLLVDEVDILFYKKFLLDTYQPIHFFPCDDFSQLLQDLWKNRKTYLQSDVASIKAHSGFQAFKRAYPNVTDKVLDETAQALFYDLQSVENGSYDYEISQEGTIGYYDDLSGDWCDTNYDGYKTTFAYIKEQQKEQVNSSEKFSDITKHVGLRLIVAKLSYLSLFFAYQSGVLGVSATVSALSELEKKIAEEEIGIKTQTVIPAPFDKKQKLSPLVKICQLYNEGVDNYFESICERIITEITEDRAVFVVFDTRDRLSNFEKYVARRPGGIANVISCDCLTAETPAMQRNHIIATAAGRRQLTLLTKEFGRGSDFVCRDQRVLESGGVHVIQTFFSSSLAEEKQIRGRTHRQDDPGSYELILWLDDLKAFSITMEDVSSAMQTDGCYAMLSEKRTAYLSKKSEALLEQKAVVDQAQNFSVNFFKTICDSQLTDKAIQQLTQLQKHSLCL